MAFKQKFVFTAVDRVSQKLDHIRMRMKGLGRQTRKTSLAIPKMTKAFGALGIAVGAGAAARGVFSAFTKFEDGLLGVQKTTGLSEEAIARLGKRLQGVALKTPLSTEKLLEFAQAAGQLGVKGQGNIEKFSTVFAKLETATDIVGDQGAQSVARILNVTKEGTGIVDRFASTLVALGNDAAATESQILTVANRVAGAVGRFGVGTQGVLAISTALKETGVEAEAGGTAISKTFIRIDNIVRKKGTPAFKALSKLTGLTGDELQKTFQKDALSVFQKFVGGLNKVQKGGGNFSSTLKILGIDGIRANDALAKISGTQGLLTNRIALANQAFSENVALQREFDIKSKSVSSSVQRLKNKFSVLGQTLGAALAPAFSKTLDVIGQIVTGTTRLINILGRLPSFARNAVQGSFLNNANKQFAPAAAAAQSAGGAGGGQFRGEVNVNFNDAPKGLRTRTGILEGAGNFALGVSTRTQ